MLLSHPHPFTCDESLGHPNVDREGVMPGISQDFVDNIVVSSHRTSFWMRPIPQDKRPKRRIGSLVHLFAGSLASIDTLYGMLRCMEG